MVEGRQGSINAGDAGWQWERKEFLWLLVDRGTDCTIISMGGSLQIVSARRAMIFSMRPAEVWRPSR